MSIRDAGVFLKRGVDSSIRRAIREVFDAKHLPASHETKRSKDENRPEESTKGASPIAPNDHESALLQHVSSMRRMFIQIDRACKADVVAQFEPPVTTLAGVATLADRESLSGRS